MGLKKFRPTTPTLRHTQVPDFKELTRSRPIKSLTERKLKTGGRDNYGHISSRWIGRPSVPCPPTRPYTIVGSDCRRMPLRSRL